jgi:hypothetical protein
MRVGRGGSWGLLTVSVVLLTSCASGASDAHGEAKTRRTPAPASVSTSAESPGSPMPSLGSSTRAPRPAPPGLRGEDPATSGVRTEGWESIVGADSVTGQSAGDVGGGVPRWINPRRAQLTVYYRFVAQDYHPQGSGIMPDVCSHPWSAAWRWISPDGSERHWVSAAPASDVVPTTDGFLVLANRLPDCPRPRAKGLTPGDSPWWFIDASGTIHRLGWTPTTTHRDPAVGPVPCRRDTYPTRYCAFDRRTMSLTPLDFIPKGMAPIRLGPNGRVWVAWPNGQLSPGTSVDLAWTDDDGKTWKGHAPESRDFSECAAGGRTAICGPGDSLSLSLDRATTWSTKPMSAWLNGVPLPRRYRLRDLTLYFPLVTRSGAIIGFVGDNGTSRYTLVRRAPGAHASFKLARVPQPTQFESVTDAAGMLVLGNIYGHVRDDRNAPAPASIYLSDNAGASWTRFTPQP